MNYHKTHPEITRVAGLAADRHRREIMTYYDNGEQDRDRYWLDCVTTGMRGIARAIDASHGRPWPTTKGTAS